MKLSIYNLGGEVVGDLELSDAVFDAPVNVPLMHQAVVQEQANARVGTASTKTRAEIRGTTRKMYKQKGTGRARHGSRKVNLWTGGGVAFGPRPRSYEQHMPKKMRRAAIRSALSVKARDGQIVLLQEDLAFERPRTKDMIGLLARLPVQGRVLFTLAEPSPNVYLSARNIPLIELRPATSLSTRTLLLHDFIVASVPAIRAVETWLSRAEAGENGSVGAAAASAAEAEAPAPRRRAARASATATAATAEPTLAEATSEEPAPKRPRARRASKEETAE